MKRLLTISLCVVLLALADDAIALPHLRHSPKRSSNVSLRKRLHINDLITEPGTFEIDWANLYSYTSQSYTMPSAFKYTPAGGSILFGRTEYSAAFDSTQVQWTATSVLFDSTHVDVALSPQVTTFLHDASGVRYGATVIARQDIGLNSIGATIGWSGATSSSASNPAGTWDWGVGLGRHLSSKGVLGRFTPHFNAGWEKSTGFDRAFSAFAGMEYQITSRVSFDATGQRISWSSAPDRQVLLGMTLNLVKPH